MAIKDVKPIIASSNQTISAGSVTKIDDITLNFATDDTTSTVIVGKILGDDKYIVELLETPQSGVAATKFLTMPGTDGTFGFSFTPIADATYKINVYRDIRIV
jgi:ribosomal protein L18E